MVGMRLQITDLIGLKIYTETGVYVGEVDDVVLNIDAKRIEALATSKLNPDIFDIEGKKGIKLPFRLIKSISDVVVLRYIPNMFTKEQ